MTTTQRETLDRIAAAALSFVGTPFVHRGRKPGVALDYGVSVTDACISMAQTIPVLEGLAQAVRSRRLTPRR